MTITFHKPWPHAITDNALSSLTVHNLTKQLNNTFFATGRFEDRISAYGLKQSFQYKMDGFRNQLPNDPGLFDINEILDHNTLMAAWDDARDNIYSIHHELEPQGRAPFNEIIIEFHRVLGTPDVPVSRLGRNRMDNYIMVDLGPEVKRSETNGFGIWEDEDTKVYTVNWARNRMLSFCGRTGLTYMTPPKTVGTKLSYFNIAMR